MHISAIIGSVLLIVSFITFTISSGRIIYQHIVEFQNWSADIPDSLILYKSFFKYSDFEKFFKYLMPVSSTSLFIGLFPLWNKLIEMNVWILLAFAVFFTTAIIINIYFVPLHQKLFSEKTDQEKKSELKNLTGQWKTGNSIRITIMLLTVCCFLKALEVCFVF